MDLDDLDPRKQPAKPKDLTAFSIEELRRYIDLLTAEIARAETVITLKTAHLDAASAIFKK
jgi:uncharacterized small protein (DUF1192 family)